jgi:hypothetical protein
MVYGGLDTYGYDDLVDDDRTDDQIRNIVDDLWDDIEHFINDEDENFQTVSKINGREFFNLPYQKENITESDDFDWVRDIKPNPFNDSYVVVFIDDLNVTANEIGALAGLAQDVGVISRDWDLLVTTLTRYANTSPEAYFKVYIDSMGQKRCAYGSEREFFEDYMWDDVYERRPRYKEYKLKDIIDD